MHHTQPHTPDRMSLGLIIAGAAAIIIATFLPFEESPSWRQIEHNTLIQQGGWILVVLALALAASGYRLGQGQSKAWWGPVIFTVLCAGYIVVSMSSSHTLYPVSPDGQVDTSAPGVTASLGIAVYVAWLGVALAFIGSLGLRRTVSRDEKGVSSQ